MNKKTVTTVLVTAIASSLITNTVRDISYIADNGEMKTKLSVISNIVDEKFLFDYDESKLADYAAMGMVWALDDPYTSYYTKEDYESYIVDVSSTYVGIGATIGVDSEAENLVVISAYDESPAQKAGVLSGDIIKAVDGGGYTVYELDDLAYDLRDGEAGSEVVVTIQRGEETFDLTIIRDVVHKVSVKSHMIDDEIGYMRIASFDYNSFEGGEDTYDEYLRELESLRTDGMQKLVIDLRDNPGGDLEVVCNITDTLIGEGTITYLEDKEGNKEYISSDNNMLGIPLVVLINGGSASASEILTGAVKDSGVGTVVGTKSFGKGIVQTVIPLFDGSGMSVTTDRYYTPAGNCIHELGIEPHVVVELPENLDKSASELEYDEDTQLQKAVDILKATE